jgi:protein disulfide-isomerase
MRKIFITLLVIFASIATQAQEGLTWHTNLNEAIEVSRNEQKPLFLFFTGSDWCGWCHRLQNEVFKTPEFVSWAKEKVVLVEVDFPRRTPQADELRKQNNELQQAFAVRGYPTVWLVKAGMKDGKTNFEQLGTNGYEAGGPTVWLANANKMLANFKPDPKPTKQQQKEIVRATKKAKKTKKKATQKS